MKIVHICLAGPVTDGWNYQDNLLSKYHKKNGNEVTIITSQWIWGTKGKLEKYNKTNYINDDGVKVIRLPIMGKDDFGRKFKKYKDLYESIETEKPDILFVHNISFVDISIIVKYCKQNQHVTVFADNHTDFSNSATNWISKNILHKIIWKHYAQKIEPYTSKFYGVLPARVDFLEKIYKLPKKKCELLVMGADDELVEAANRIEIRKNIRKKYDIADDDFLIMTGGKIDAWKTQTLLLMEAVHNINNPKVKLIVFGSVDDAIKEKVEKLSDGIKVQYIGWVESRKSYEYFAASNLVVFPGRHSVFWEQVVGQGIPMICKYWEGTTHVDVGGNVKFWDEHTDLLEDVIKNVLDESVLKEMMDIAQTDGKLKFLYSRIALASIFKSLI